MERRYLRATYEDDLNRLKTAQKNAAVADLKKTRNQALSDLAAERNQNTAFYNQQRSSANVQNRLSAKNFQEYLAQTGRANSGLGAQARMQNANNLNTSINALNVGEAGALADINRRTTDAQKAYNTGLASANANIEANYIQNLIEQRNKELERDLAERQFQESIRQFNENQALQRAAMYSKSSGSGGGSSSGTSGSDYTFTDTQTQSSNSGKKASKALTNELNKKAKTNKGWSYYDTGKSTIRGYQVNGTFYYKKGDKWVAL